jgi:hypothetical protein
MGWTVYQVTLLCINWLLHYTCTAGLLRAFTALADACSMCISTWILLALRLLLCVVPGLTVPKLHYYYGSAFPPFTSLTEPKFL